MIKSQMVLLQNNYENLILGVVDLVHPDELIFWGQVRYTRY